jgi:hypothetical protein
VEEEEVPINILAQIAAPPPSSGSKGAAAASATVKKDKGTSKKKSKIAGAYELEKALLRVQHDLPALQEILRSIQGNIHRVLMDTIEPEVMRLLLQGVGRLFAAGTGTGMNAAEVMAWYEKISQLNNFRLLYALLPDEHVLSLQTVLREVLTDQVNTDRKVALQAAYGIEKR